MQNPVYLPSVFDVNNIKQAKEIILTPEGGETTDQRWERETPVIVEKILKADEIKSSSIILDYGCGVGRIAKELIKATGCFVVGVDISPSMRALAADYVNSPNFMACAPEMLDRIGPISFDAAYAIWVLQHSITPELDCHRILRNLKPKSPFFVLNNFNRAIPTNDGWIDDNISINAIINKVGFDDTEIAERLPKECCSQVVHRNTFWKMYRA